ncbi:MAG: 6,7-dimethyl-8-ribityllumazine synthase [Lentisphaerae bacterium]|nr:6,7-dimethyl-8-ribityllumazine synthase [Lentisphaerota bacterium]
MNVKTVSANLTVKGQKFGVVVSRFNDFLTRQLVDGAVDCLVRHGCAEKDITVAWVPGANEIPIVVNAMARKGGVSAIVALGAVVQGSTPHAGLINTQVSRSLSSISLDSGIPVVNGVVCADTLEQAIERCGTKAGNKGWSAAQAAIEMANLLESME